MKSVALRTCVVLGFGALTAALVWALRGPGVMLLGGNSLRNLYGKDYFDAVHATRQLGLQIIVGIAAIAALTFTARTYHLSKRGQITDRYSKAIGQLASERIDVRAGGIYALEHVMQESPRDHQASIDVVAAYLRDQAQRTDDVDINNLVGNASEMPSQDSSPAGQRRAALGRHLRPDIQAALDVLARRPKRQERGGLDLSVTELSGAQVHKADLRRANMAQVRMIDSSLRESDLRKTVFHLADLTQADFSDCKLAGCDFSRGSLFNVNLKDMDLRKCKFDGTLLHQADLSGADLRGASFAGAKLGYTNLSGADLRGVDLSTAVGVELDFIENIKKDGNTRLPSPLSYSRGGGPGPSSGH